MDRSQLIGALSNGIPATLATDLTDEYLQMRQDLGRDNTCFVHVTLIPWIAAAQELKTKPTQHSV